MISANTYPQYHQISINDFSSLKNVDLQRITSFQLSILLIDFTDADFAELDFACEVVHLQQNTALFITIFGIVAVSCGLAVDPCL